MMPNRLMPRHYLDPAVLAAEHGRVFRTHWHLVGLARDLPAETDWFLTEIAGTELIVQRAGEGDFRAFVNTCPHRFNALVRAPKGHGRLRCGYHLWTFDGDGKPAVVPLRPGLPLEACQTEALSLRRWSVALCGELIFVAARPDKPLKDFLGPLAEPLAQLSRGLGAEVLRFSQDIAANWKVILQNTVEFDHAFAVHPETFAPMVERPLALVPHETAPPHLAYHTVMRRRDDIKPIEKRIEDIFARSVIPRAEGYSHATLFPSATIGTTGNRLFALIGYQPLSPALTRAEYRLFVSRIADVTPVEEAILSKVIPADVAFTQRLLEEDRQICESVQRGLGNAPEALGGVLMPGEQLVARFQQYWLDAVGGAALTSPSAPLG
jgi:phenylpropionate dioxygenase-like ring-hydroxylating dioxygenase large terminal subunit